MKAHTLNVSPLEWIPTSERGTSARDEDAIAMDDDVEATMTDRGSPFAPHTAAETAAMLDAVGAESEEDLFDIPDAVRFDGDLGIDGGTERAVRADVAGTLSKNATRAEFLGRGHHDHYVPSIVDHLADRSEFLTSYTQYQPEVTQGFLQALFEYQSILVELTGLGVANASMYDPATALGEAALLSSRVRSTSGERVLVPEIIREERRDVLENYVDGAGFAVDTYPTRDGNADVDRLRETIDEDVSMVYLENPNALGAIEESIPEIAGVAEERNALAVLGSDPVALSLLTEPATAGIDVVIGDAAALGLGTAFGMGLGLFACREEYLRQVPGRLVGAGEDADGKRAYTLTLQTREQHIRRERATSNICTNQAWVALRAAIHAASLGPDGLVSLAKRCVELPRDLADRLDSISGVTAPIHDRHHFREFRARTDEPAAAIAADLAEEGFLVHAVGDHDLQIGVTETNEGEIDAFVGAMEVVA